MADTEMLADTDTEMSAETDTETDNFRSLILNIPTLAKYNPANPLTIPQSSL